MTRFILKRIFSGLLVIWGIVTLLFLIFNILGNPAESMTDENTDAATRAAIEHAYHLDQPMLVQYFYYLNDLSPMGLVEKEAANGAVQRGWPLFSVSKNQSFSLKWPWLRRSFQSNKQVTEMLAERLPGTAVLALAAMSLAIFLGIPLGIYSALKKNKWQDRSISFLTLLGISGPSFFIAVIIIRIFAVDLGPWTGLHASGYMFEENIFSDGYSIKWGNLILPAIALGLRPLSIITQLTRASLHDVLGSDYVRTARAKGLSEQWVLFKHALRNALNPVLTSISGWFASLLAGAFFIEAIFDWQGLGKLTIDALGTKDYPVILGATIFIGCIFVLVNILVDVLYTILDPRIKLA